jgi:hypothetical protein
VPQLEASIPDKDGNIGIEAAKEIHEILPHSECEAENTDDQFY